MWLIAPEDGPLSETLELRDSLVSVTLSGGKDMELKIFRRCNVTEKGSALPSPKRLRAGRSKVSPSRPSFGFKCTFHSILIFSHFLIYPKRVTEILP